VARPRCHQPFAESGGLVNLDDYPRLRHYLEVRRDVIAGRHCAQKAPANWYRTIDRIYPTLAERPKLLIPDIKGEAHVVLKVASCTPTTTSTTSHQMTGICGLYRPCCCPLSLDCSWRPIQRKCGADFCAFRRSTCAESAFRDGRMCLNCCAASWPRLPSSEMHNPVTRLCSNSTA